jgi:hypothetical protein
MANDGPKMPHAAAILDFVSSIIADIREQVVEEPWFGRPVSADPAAPEQESWLDRLPAEFFVSPHEQDEGRDQGATTELDLDL